MTRVNERPSGRLVEPIREA